MCSCTSEIFRASPPSTGREASRLNLSQAEIQRGGREVAQTLDVQLDKEHRECGTLVL
jgi:hypothetical protein